MTFEAARFGDLFSEPQRNGLTRPKKVRGTGLPMVNMGELFAHPRIHNLKMDLVPVDEKEQHYLLKAGDLLFARQSLVLSGAGQCSVFLGNNAPTVFESHLIRCRLDAQRSNPHFYFYFFRSPDGRRVIEAIVEQGAGASGIRGSDLINVQVPNPPKEVQDDIAKVLGALDDRITLLRETNATLEAIAQALFKSWFVDFDPVRAKMAGPVPEGDAQGSASDAGGRMPRASMDEATAALFPDALEETELGLVPKGWQPTRIDSFIELAYGKALKAETRRPGSVPVYGSGGITGWHDEALVQGPSIIIGRKGTVGSLYWESRPFYPIDTVFYVKSARPLSYCYQLLKTLGLSDMNTDAAVPGLNRENVYRLLVPNPPEAIVNAFDENARSLRQMIDHHAQQLDVLVELRDTLLPRLISGQLRLPEAEDAIEEAIA